MANTPCSSEIFIGSSLLERLQANFAREYIDLSSDDEESDSSPSSTNLYQESIISIPRTHLYGSAKEVVPLETLTDYICQPICANSHYEHIPYLLQYSIPLLIAALDTLIIAPPGCSQIDAIILPILQQIISCSRSGKDRKLDKRPFAVILTNQPKLRTNIYAKAVKLATDLDISIGNIRTTEELNNYYHEKENKLDLLITSPAAFRTFVKRRIGYTMRDREGGRVYIDQLQYVVVMELEELIDLSFDCVQFFSSLRTSHPDMTLVMLTHTPYVKRGSMNKIDVISRSKLINLLNLDAGIIALDPSIALSNYIIFSNDMYKRCLTMKILEDHRERYRREGNDGYYYLRSILIIVSSNEQARFLSAYFTSMSPFSSDEMLLIDTSFRGGYKSIRDGKYVVLFTSQPKSIRLSSIIIDKIIFFDLIPSINRIVFNCTRIVPDRKTFFLLNHNDLVNKKSEIVSLVQYLMDHKSPIPPELMTIYNELSPTVSIEPSLYPFSS